ncbi:hypothetical protein AF332_20740 [Sporosarcina globispora]|uniref:Uncharacterized protein n=1 Tax=Sporosarcina globispora TaxID=1459 RepID=A0A0M0GGE9_SPOGL|nr:hypothetical protein AF332_20740 [Sporosarcina globispora]
MFLFLRKNSEGMNLLKILQFLSEFEMTLSGGFAVYALLCMGFVTIVGFTQFLGWVLEKLP